MIMRHIKQFLLQCYFFVRLPFLWLIASVFPSRPLRAASGPKRILLVRLDRLGDFVLSLPVIENIKANCPDTKISVLVRPYLAGLAASIKSIDSVITYDGFFRTVRRLRRERFDVAIDMLCDYLLKPALVTFLSAAPRRIGFAGGFREILFTDAVSPEAGNRLMLEINLELVRALGFGAQVTVPHIVLKGASIIRSRVVAIHPGGHYPSQCWPAERFAAVARMIAATYDVDILVIGGPEERALVGDIMTGLADIQAQSVFPDMKELAFLFARSLLVICNNSGPLHLAAAVGTPTVSTMGPTDPHRWWPQGKDQIVIRKEIPCSACGRGNCADHSCMNLITAVEVFEAARTIMDKTNGITKR